MEQCISADVSENDSPFQQMFLEFQSELDSRNDKFERLVKCSRDITIESKRLIFQLHRIDSAADRKEALSEAHRRLVALQSTKWRHVACELENEDPYQYLRAYSPGLQEYIEALSFWHYLEYQTLISLNEVASTLQFTRNKTIRPTPSSDVLLSATGDPSSHGDAASSLLLFVHVPPTEYLLGIADLTGELMRLAIHSVGQGSDLSAPFRLCAFLGDLQAAFASIGSASCRDLGRKMAVMRQSQRKVEAACYALRVRGSEVPRHLLADALSHARCYDGLEENLPDVTQLD